jgi:hypothetical protein
MAPLTGLETRRLAPLWAHAGNLLYKRGEALYGFEGLRRYKSKFCPIWMPRYIAAVGNVSLARSLIDLNSLISGGGGRVGQQSMVWLPDLHLSASHQAAHLDGDDGGHKQDGGDDPSSARSRAGADVG